MASLHDKLWNLTVDDLNLRLQVLGSKAKSPRKADLIDAIKARLTGDAMRQEWNLLSELEKAAVAEACYAPNRLHLEDRVRAKYGELPPFFKPSTKVGSYPRWDRKNPTHLILFLYPDLISRGYQIPHDLADALSRFVPQPPDLEISGMADPKEEEGLFLRHTEGDALAEVLALLRLAEQGKLGATAKTGMPTASGRNTILECLSDGDFYPDEIANPPDQKGWQQVIGDIKPVGWVRLLQSAGYLDSGKAKSKLTPAGIKALAKPPAEIIAHLWKSWLSTNKFDEFNRIDEIKGQMSKGHMTAKPPRRQAIVDALTNCPASEWIDLRKFFSFMQAEGFDFEVTRDPWKLYLGEQQYGSFGYDGYGGWDIIQLRYLQVFLFEYAATLGLIDLAYVHPSGALPDFSDQWGADDLEWLSAYDGLRSFRITNLGAYCLGMRKEFDRTKPVSALEIAVSPDLTIRIPPTSLLPSDRLLLETWAEPVDSRTWRLDPLRSRDAIERGQSMADFAAFLRVADRNPLPEAVEKFLKDIQHDATAVRSLGGATLYACRDAETATMIAGDKVFKNLCHRCGETQLAVPVAQLVKFQKQVHAMGLGIV